MIDTQLFHEVLLTLAILVGLAAALSVAMLMAASVSRPGQPPHGGIRRDPAGRPEPDTDDAHELVPDDARELVPDDARELVLR